MTRKRRSAAAARRLSVVQPSSPVVVGEALRDAYGHVLSEPVPESLKKMIQRLREEERNRERRK